MKILKKGSRGDDVKILQCALHLYQDGIFGSLTEEAVKEFQKAHNLVADGIVGEKTWQLILNDSLFVKKSTRTIKEIIVHCSATLEGKAYTVDDIRLWHKQKGWSDIGYHYVVYLDGSIHNGRNVNISGAHCEGHNTHSIGVCYIGGLDARTKKDKDTRTDKQKDALVGLLKRLRGLYPNARIYGHNNFSSKRCPCFDAKTEYRNI
jgi:N-acetylmuramoyl-L-alanine amidase